MNRILTAFRAFFICLFYRETAVRVQHALDSVGEPAPESKITLPTSVEIPKAAPQKPRQSEALTLLSTLQREARLVDFLKEDLSGYSDEQVGAAVREIHREGSLVIDRLFGIRPILAESEGESVEVPVGFDGARYRVTGKLGASAPFRGTLRHHGWEATKCELPEFVGNQSASKTVAPAEVEVQ